MEFPWGHQRRFNAYPEYIRKIFGERVQKLTINAGFTCPNRDGSISTGGCIFCNNNAFNPSYCTPDKSIEQQLQEGMEFHKRRYRKARKYFAYFQAYSNTYARFEQLKQMFDNTLNIPGIVGLVIGTRPDCVDDELLDYLQHLAQSYHIIVEYGIESCYNKTLEQINRGHSFEASVEAIHKTADRGIHTGGHLIFGLPGETKNDMLKEADIISRLPLSNMKFHQLQILKNTYLAELYVHNPQSFDLFTFEEYLDFFIDFIERLNPHFVIERFAGEVPPDFLLAPDFGTIRNFQIQKRFEERLSERDTWQGKKYPARENV